MELKKVLLVLSFSGLVSCATVLPSSKPLSSSSCYNSGVESSIYESESTVYIGFYELCEGLYVNHLPGLYDSGFELEFIVDNENYELYYTQDCSKPLIDDEHLYIDPIEINVCESNDYNDYPLTTSVDGILGGYTDKCYSAAYVENVQVKNNYYLLPKQTVLTIMLYDKSFEEVVLNRSLTYIIDENNIDIPIVSLSMPYSDWFGKDGFYNKIKDDIEKRGNLEYFDPVNDDYFYRNTQVKLGGNFTLGYPQRTLNLNFNKDENGDKNIPVDIAIFKDKQKRDGSGVIDSLTRFRLHNGGNCFENFTGFNDALLQAMMEEDCNVSTTGYRPCIAYLNGEYWGIYAIREHYKDTYFETHYNVSKKNVIFYELKQDFVHSDGDEEKGEECINELKGYLNNDFTNDEVYNTFITDYVDIDSFIDVVLANLYAGNFDFLGNFNNLKMWRTYKVEEGNEYADKRWRFVIHDSDYAFTDEANFLDPNHNYAYSKFPMLKKLLSNNSFKDRLYERAEYLLDNYLNSENGENLLSSMVNEIKPYKIESAHRWGQVVPTAYKNYWEGQIERVKTIMNNKDKNFLETLRRTLTKY